MTHTFRQCSRIKLDYCIEKTQYNAGSYIDVIWLSVTKGGWKEARRLLGKEEYAKLRKKQGDCLTKDFRISGVPHWYRHELEKKHRHHTSRELHRFMRNAEYDPMVSENPDRADLWYFY